MVIICLILSYLSFNYCYFYVQLNVKEFFNNVVGR